MLDLKIASININGLSSLAKFIFSQHLHIICLQEIHLINSNAIQSWAAKHKFTLYTNTRYGNTRDKSFKAGTAIIINNSLLNVPEKDIKPSIIVANRIQSLYLKTKRFSFFILNVYFPSGASSRPQELRMNCIETLRNFLLESHLSFQTKLLLLGDFNVVLSPKDRTSTYKPNTPDKLLFSSFLQNHGLSDIFRYTSPNKISYSYFTSKSASRLDRIYVPLDGLQNLCKIEYIP